MTSEEIRQSIGNHAEDWEDALSKISLTVENRFGDFLGAPTITDDGHVVFHEQAHFSLWTWHVLGKAIEAAVHHYLDVAFEEETPDPDIPRAKKGPFAKEPFRIDRNAPLPEFQSYA